MIYKETVKKGINSRKKSKDMIPGRHRGSVQVTEASSLTGFLHESTKLELFSGQEAYML